MKTPIRSRLAQTLVVALTAATVAIATPLAAHAAYPSDDTRPDSLDVLGGYDAIWQSDGQHTMDGTVVDAATAAANDELTVWVNQNATTDQQLRALQDANYDAALLVGTGLGSVLQPLYIQAMRNGRLPLTRALMDSMAAYANTDAAKAQFDYPRPFLATDAGATGVACDATAYNASSLSGIRVGEAYADAGGNLLLDQVAEMTDSSGVFTDPRQVGVGYGGYCASASFPSGHTTNSNLAGVTLATLVPELAAGILGRVSEMGTDRIVLGMHYPLDVMGGRIAGQSQVAERWADTAYRRDMIEPARAELVAYLEEACGDTLAACAAAGTAYRSDPFGGAAAPGGTDQAITDAASAIAVYHERLTYGFEPTGDTTLDASVPDTAAELLRTAFPTLDTAQRASILAQTELASGYPLDRTGTETGSWQRIDLAAAMTATVDLAADGTVDVVATGTIPTVVPADGPQLVLTDGPSVEVDSALALAASGLTADSEYRVVFGDDRATVLGTLRSNATGGLSGSVTIPADAATGDRTIELLAGDGSVAASASVTVTAPLVYEIATEADLELLRAHPDGTFELTADIAMTARWTPVPTFSGELRGNGHVITDLEIVTSGNQGFVAVNNGTIRGIGFVDAVSLNTAQASAGVVVSNNNGTVDQVFVRNGTVTGAHRSGMIVANNYGTISNSYSTGRASGQWETGGISAWNESTAVLRDNYSTVRVTAAYANVGTIAGVGNGGGVFSGNVALDGNVEGTSGNAARVVGVGSATLSDNLSLSSITVNGYAVTGASATNLQGASTSAADLRKQETYAALGWDFDTVWRWSDEAQRPVLRAVAEPADVLTGSDTTAVGTLVPRAIAQMRNNLLEDANLTTDAIGEVSAAEGAAWHRMIDTWGAANTAFHASPTVPADLPTSGHVFVLLGYQLNDDGTAQPTLISRLEQALAGLDAYPDSRIVVTGGVARNNQTEAGVMRQWLLAHGVAEDRIIFENAATDTPTNGINTMALLYADPSVTSYTLISSASHLRRATVVFEAASLAEQLRTGAASPLASIGNIAYVDNQSSETAPTASERDSITQNVAKVWDATVETDAFKGVQRSIVGRMVDAQRRGDAVDVLRSIAQIRTTSPEYADRLETLIARWSEALTMPEFEEDVPADVPATGHTFIVPGSALNDDGTLTQTSISRLEIALQGLEQHPGSTVTVVGGAARNNVTEAGAQRTWLLDNGVADDRIVVVDTSSSLVEGAQQAMLALSARGDTTYTVITSSSVLRRTLSVYASGATYAASNNADGSVPAPAGHVAVNDTVQLRSLPLLGADDGTRRTIAENVADVLGVRGEYNGFASNAPSVPALSSIALTAPARTAYLVGDALDVTGMSVIAAFEDASSLDVTSVAALSGFDGGTPGVQEVTATVVDGAQTRTATFAVTVRLADAAALEQAISAAAAITADGYTAESFAALQAGIAAAHAVAADLGADADAIAAALSDLRAAIDALVAVAGPVDPSTDPVPAVPAPSATPVPAATGALPATGGELAIGALAVGLALLLGGAAVLGARRRLTR
jgi:LPXTG-motif cell wall-anchored protein